MTDEMGTWLIIALAILGVAASIVDFLKTPRERRYRNAPVVPIEEQLKEFPESAQAVIIKGNKRRALLKSAPYIFIGFLLTGFSLWGKNASHPECVKLLGLNATYIWMLLFCYGLPIGLFILSLLFLNRNKNHKNGIFSTTRFCCILGHDCQEGDNTDTSWSYSFGTTHCHPLHCVSW